MAIGNWEHFFKPEIRSSGKTLLGKDKASLSSPSDTEIVVYIRVSPPIKVTLKSKNVESSTVLADCNCPVGRKGSFCKHVWAALLLTEEKKSDFLDGKKDLELDETGFQNLTTQNKVSAGATAKESSFKTQRPPPSAAFAAKQAEYKEKQSLYRKIQYQKQKLRAQEYKKRKEAAPSLVESFPDNIERALSFFSENGIELRENLNSETAAAAKKKLARIFHPDTGGSHEEILALNGHSEALAQFLKSRTSGR